MPAAELMDQPDVDQAQLAQGLADLRRVNRWFGGTRAALSAMLPVVRRIDEDEVRVLDVATGSGDIPLALARRARREGIQLRVLATDLHPVTVAAARALTARNPDIEVGLADALDLQFETGEFHVAMCHTALHHFDEPAARRLLSELARVATEAVVITDLARGRTAVMAVALLAHTLWRRHPVTRHDGTVSIRGAYTPDEAACLAVEAGLPRAVVRLHLMFRFSLVAQLRGPSA